MSAPLSFDHVSFSYPGTPVFEDLDLAIEKGELTAVLGPNGAGKTTLARLATRIREADRGTVRLEGDAVDSLARKVIARRVAVVPQEEQDVFSFSVLQAVLMGRTPWRRGLLFESGRDREIAEECLRAVDAVDLLSRDLRELSGGERQRVRLARALAQQAGLLILDEPTSHQDLKHQVETLRLLRELREREGLTVLVISHDVNLCSRFADRVVLLSGGRVAADGPAEEVIAEEVLTRVYGTRIRVGRIEGAEGRFVFPE
jgi:iron complex transport system ATP-binding protein